MKAHWLLVFSMAATPAEALDGLLAQGLTVHAEALSGTVTVDGVPLSIERITGAGVIELVQRIQARWRSEGSEVNTLHLGEWTVHSRLTGAASEVVQVRSSGSAAELLWSRLQGGRALQTLPRVALPLPAGCQWGRTTWGSSAPRLFVQRTARCTSAAAQVLPQLQRLLPAAGWTVRSAGEHGVLAFRKGMEAVVSLTTMPGDAATWLVWLYVEAQR